ncbi:MAG: ISKra4 family transposase, partial [Pseudanabaena sp.]
AACKVIIKARLGCSGMKWKDWGASVVLSLRALSYTKGRWQQFWSKISRYGFSL